MSEQTKREAEERALEALIVSQLRREHDLSRPERLPELTGEEKAALSALGPNLVDRLWDAADADTDDDDPVSVYDDAEFVMSEDVAFAGMNRADEVDEETKANLEKRRKEVLERLRKKKAGEDHPSA